MSQCTWEPMKNLMTAIELVEEYNRLHPISLPIKNKSDIKKKDDTFIGKKRNESPLKNENKENNIQEKGPNLIHIKDEIQIYEMDSKPEIKEENEKFEKTYIIDDNLKSVITVKQQNETLLAIVDKFNENGELYKISISTDELRRKNPWILLDFYESKIKFT